MAHLVTLNDLFYITFSSDPVSALVTFAGTHPPIAAVRELEGYVERSPQDERPFRMVPIVFDRLQFDLAQNGTSRRGPFRRHVGRVAQARMGWRGGRVSAPTDGTAANTRPAFLITVDTEGDNLWARPREITTRNSDYVPRFQALCESYGFKVTYLVNYEMAVCPRFQEIGRDVLARATGEIGMHLHAWNSPPLIPLTDDDLRHQPYLAEYPPELVREKVGFMTDLLGETFSTTVVSHRAGRWNLSPTYARTLVDHGYLVDCSVTPHVSWRRNLGDPGGSGGPDYTLFPERPYFLDLDELSRAGASSLLEVPLTILSRRRGVCRLLPARVRSQRFVQRVLDRLLPTDWLMAQRRNREAMRTVVPRALARGWPCLVLALHSSELMPGGSPAFRDEAEIEALYERFAAVFESARDRTRGATMAEYRASFRQPAPPS